jgi:hypothetical protein
MKQFAFLTAPFDCGWYIYVKATLVSICWHNSLNIALLMYFALSIVMCLDTPYQQIMFCQKNFLILAELTFVSGFAPIRFMKYLTATNAKV